jgi:glycolate dehydrogenase FAD-binding subunit
MSTAARILPSRLGDTVGPEHFSTDPAELTKYDVDGMKPAAVARPGTAAEVADLIRLAAAEKLAVIPVGAHTKLSIGMPPSRYDLAIDMRRLNRVAAYDPGDLTLGVEPGCKLGDLHKTLEEHNQTLPLAVPYTFQTTVGGTISSGVDTPLRQFYGTARDYVLGMEFVTGEGAQTKSGGRVVKNVTGYDLHKLMIGALGTLGVITRINFKTFPLPRQSRGFLAFFPGAAGPLDLRQRIAQSPLTPLTLEILSPEVARIFAQKTPTTVPDAPAPGAWLSTAHWVLAAAYAGNDQVLDRYARDLTRMATETGAADSVILGDAERPTVWWRLREFIPLMLDSSPAATIVKFSVLPGHFPALLEQTGRIVERYELSSATLLRGSGIAYLALLPPARDEDSLHRLALACGEIFQASPTAEYRAMIPWCPVELKRAVNVWGPPRDDSKLMRKLRSVFDPQNIFSPGRFVGGL